MSPVATRAKWFVRRKNPPRIQLTKRDRQILAFAYEHRLMSTAHVYTLVGAMTPAQQSKIRKRLRLLFDHLFLDMPRLQIVDHLRKGSVPKVYSLARNGATEIEKSWGARKEVRHRFFRHTLMTTSIMAAFANGARELGTVRIVPLAELLEGASEKTLVEPERWKTTVSRREAEQITWREDIGITPDKIFGIEFLNAPEGKGRFLLFLEADRGTEPVVRKFTRGMIPRPRQLSSIFGKLLCYKATYNDALEGRYGFDNGFRVLTVTTTRDRVQSMVEASAKLTGTRRMFLFAAEEDITSGNPLTFEWVNGNGERTSLVDSEF